MSQLQAGAKAVAFDSLARRDPSAEAPGSSTSNPMQIGPDEPFFQFFPDDYWSAVADFDVEGARALAATPPEVRFSEAIALMAAGEFEKAEDMFTELSGEPHDLTIAVTAKNLLAMTLLYENKWTSLRSLDEEWKLSPGDRQNIPALRWGEAFARAPAMGMSFPDMPVAIPLHMTVVGTPIIRVAINGKQYDFWLDTGSSITVLSSSVAEEAHVAPLGTGTLDVGTFNGVVKVKPAVVERIDIGELGLTNSPAVIMDDALMRVHATGDGIPSAGLNVAGIIGWDVIRHFEVAMNYRAGEAVFRRPRDLRTRGTSEQNLTWAGKPLVTVRARYVGILHFTLDTGAQSTLIDDSAIERLRLRAVPTSARAYGIGKAAGRPVRVVHQARLNIGGRQLLMKEIIVNDQPRGGVIRSDGILGSDVAQFGTILIDATNGLFSVVAD